MAIYRIHKEDNFVIIDKAFLLNEEISLKAKGLLALLLSYPDNWQFYKAEISTAHNRQRKFIKQWAKRVNRKRLYSAKATQR